MTITFAPARSNAFALSYSQLVPGNTGINTVGCAILCLHTYTLDAWNSPSSPSLPSEDCSSSTSGTALPVSAPDTVLNTLSRVLFPCVYCFFNCDLRYYHMQSSASVCHFTDHSICQLPSSSTLISRHLSHDICQMPVQITDLLGSTLCSIFTPMLLPNAILLTAGTTPCPSNA